MIFWLAALATQKNAYCDRYVPCAVKYMLCMTKARNLSSVLKPSYYIGTILWVGVIGVLQLDSKP